MNMKILPVALLAACVAFSANAQNKENSESKNKIKKDQSITIRKKNDSNEKTTIVIDGDNITVNGKPLEDLQDGDIEVLRNKSMGLMPKIRGRLAPMGSMKMFGEAFPFGGNRAFLGVGSEKTEKGAKIISIEKGSAAEKAGLKKDDIITKVGDAKIEGSDDLFEAIGKYKPEEKVTITYLREGKEITATAILGKKVNAEPRIFNFKGKDFNEDFNFNMPDIPGANEMDLDYHVRKPRLGLEIQDLPEGKGVKILDANGDSPAEKAGLQKDDVITEVDGKSVATVDELKTKVKELKEGDSIQVTYQRNGKTQTTEIKIPKKLKTAEL